MCSHETSTETSRTLFVTSQTVFGCLLISFLCTKLPDKTCYSFICELISIMFKIKFFLTVTICIVSNRYINIAFFWFFSFNNSIFCILQKFPWPSLTVYFTRVYKLWQSVMKIVYILFILNIIKTFF